jgi:transcription antitermination factor NusG
MISEESVDFEQRAASASQGMWLADSPSQSGGPAVRPPPLPPSIEETIVNLTESWYALYVRSHAERSVSTQLAGKGYESFVPMYTSRSRVAVRAKDVERPLFPNYIFCRITSASSGRIVTTPGVVRIVGYGNVPIPLDDGEIESIRQIVATAPRVEPWPRLEPGTRVEIADGPLRGVQGVLTRVAGGHRLIVSVTLLRRSVAVEVSADDVLALHPMHDLRPDGMCVGPRQHLA